MAEQVRLSRLGRTWGHPLPSPSGALSLVLAALLLSFNGAGFSAARAAGGDLRLDVIDVGTGLACYVELPTSRLGGRPYRIVYDAGKDRSSGPDNVLVRHLTSPDVGLEVAREGFEGSVIDLFVLSHPHEDHYNGARALFAAFDVRAVMESKQVDSPRYLKQFKAPALQEILAARARGVEAHYYLVGLPYPNGFDVPRGGRPYDEYALASKNLPGWASGRVDPRRHSGKVTFPFGPAQVAQPVEVPVVELLAHHERSLSRLPEELRLASLEVEVLPVGTRLDVGREARVTVVHADTVAALTTEDSSSLYREAWPYYGGYDANDQSLSLQVRYRRATALLPGDSEGRSHKPRARVSLAEVFGSPDAYGQGDLERYLDLDGAAPLPLRREVRRFVLSSAAYLDLISKAYVTYDRIAPEAVEARVGDRELSFPARAYADGSALPLDVVDWGRLTDLQKSRIHPFWRYRLHGLHESLRTNSKTRTALEQRFRGWTRGAHPRLVHDGERLRLETEAPVWTVTNLFQLAERIQWVDPWLANLMAGSIMASDVFLDYIAPEEPSAQALRSERHMLDLADQIARESGEDILRSDVLVLGHHGSFTSSSTGFVHRVDPNVGVISADDQSYSGSTLPDFLAQFWNLNTTHPGSRRNLHSMFFHADMLARSRGERDAYAEENRFSASAGRLFRRRGRRALPLWRTDLNDDLRDANALRDTVRITSAGGPVWEFVREGKAASVVAAAREGSAAPGAHVYYAQELVGAQVPGAERLAPHDPTGTVRTLRSGEAP